MHTCHMIDGVLYVTPGPAKGIRTSPESGNSHCIEHGYEPICVAITLRKATANNFSVAVA